MTFKRLTTKQSYKRWNVIKKIKQEIEGDCFMLEDHQFMWGHRREGNLDITREGKGRNTWICIKCGKKESICKVGGFHEPR